MEFDRDARCERKARTPLAVAAFCGSSQAAEVLLAAGADANALDAVGNAPLHWAAIGGHVALCSSLLASGADAALATQSGATASELARAAELRAALQEAMAAPPAARPPAATRSQHAALTGRPAGRIITNIGGKAQQLVPLRPRPPPMQR